MRPNGEVQGKGHGSTFNDGDFYKWLEGASATLAVTNDPTSKRHPVLACSDAAGAGIEPVPAQGPIGRAAAEPGARIDVHLAQEKPDRATQSARPERPRAVAGQ